VRVELLGIATPDDTVSASLDYLLASPDAFALFGFERSFDINTTQLDERHARLTEQARAASADNPQKSTRVVEKLAEGHKALSDPVRRGELLLEGMGGKSDPGTTALPPRFLEGADERTKDADGYDHDWRQLILQASNLFRLMGSADNAVVKRARRQQIRQVLNGLREIQRRRAAIP
jgi:hypothetical protein